MIMLFGIGIGGVRALRGCGYRGEGRSAPGAQRGGVG